jgi:thiol-disulfide isomerase/thioredoxin
MKKVLLSFLCVTFVALCAAQTQLKSGIWRGLIYYRDGSELPFNISVSGSTPNSRVYFLNGSEKFAADKLDFKADSVSILINEFDNELALKFEGSDRLVGLYRKQDNKNQPEYDSNGLPIPAPNSSLPLKVTLEFGKAYRFKENPSKSAFNLAGKWDIVYSNDDGTETKSVGVFQQEGTKLTGTILNSTGDSRYLEGNVDGKTFSLSSFIGTSPTLLMGAILDANTISGESKSPAKTTKFVASKNANAALPDAYTLTRMKPGITGLEFNLPDVNGKAVSNRDDKFKGKPYIVTLSGTWCPNCMDEIAFLAPWYKENKNKGIELVSIYYERKTDPEYVKRALARVKDKYGIEYQQLVGGLTDNKSVLASLPALENFKAFPTTIFVDKKGNVRKIHTGFNGPATGKYYEDFKLEFNKEVKKLLQE